ncbi:hypothetical protein BGX24_009768 [Mortierella sp. AD032]|nr:hypothetical protein BGX24_009768 [Mortierella sp. AD032]
MALQQQRRLGHSWISGHPHSLLYKPATAANQSKHTGACGSGNGVNTGAGSSANGGSSSGNSSSSSFLDFAGNSRYQAYTLARFSTLSVASSASSSSSSFSTSSSLGEAGSSGSQVSGSSSIRQEPTDSSSGRHYEDDRPHSNPADTQSPVSSSTSTTTSSTSPLPASTLSSSSVSKKEHDDTEDAWAVNESYSGHASSSSNATSSDNGTKNDHSRTPPSFQTDSTSSKPRDPAAIEASWRRTSDSIPSTPFSGNNVLSSSSSSKAGGLDLSSSTLVQQMLFKERAPHADSSEDDNGKAKQDQQHSSKEELSAFQDQSSADSTTASPSLTSMLLNQSSVDPSDVRKTKATTQQQQSQAATSSQEEEDHISKLDIRVGIVRSVTAHPDAESLYIEQVDVGDKENGEAKEPRTIVSGLVRHVPKEYLEGRAVIVVGNMKPSKLRGVMSQGMLLCAMEQDDKGVVTKVGLLEPAEGSEAGDKVTLEGFTDLETVPATVLTPKKKWFEKSRVHFSVQDGVAYYKGSPFRTVKGLVRCKSISKGEIS